MLVLLLACPVNRGATQSQINPALGYYEALLLTPKLDPADSQYLFGTDWRGRTLDERGGKLLSQYDDSFRWLAKAAAATTPCEWGTDLQAGPALASARFAPAKHLVQTARLRAHWHLQNNQQLEAQSDLLVALALGRNLSRDGRQLSALLQYSIEALVALGVAENFYAFAPDSLQLLVDGLGHAPRRGTLAETLPAERYLLHDWYLVKIRELQRAYPGDDAKVLEAMRGLIAVNQNEETNQFVDRVIAASDGTSEGLLRLFLQLETYFQEVAQLLPLPYPEFSPKFDEFKARLRKAGNPLASRLLGYERAKRAETATAVDLAMVRAAILYRLRGEAGLASVSDPCGDGPFELSRLRFEGVDRGFQLRSKLAVDQLQECLIFVEREGKPFILSGPSAGEPVLDQAERFRRRYGLDPTTNAGK